MAHSHSYSYSYSFVAVLAALALGCASQAPFVASTDCGKLRFCGQCASRGGCAWCGPKEDSAGGQCLAVGAAACLAPLSLCQTPDRCPPPPLDGMASAITAAPSAEQEAVGSKQYGEIKGALHRAFPQATVTNPIVDKVVRFLLHRGSGPNQDGSGREVAPWSRRVAEQQHPLYLGDAIHYRVKSMPPAAEPMLSEFMVTLPMVRVPLPERLDRADPRHPGSEKPIQTALGEVHLSRDHLLGSIEQIADKYSGAEYLGYRPARVDLITPARVSGTRFAAIAVYLGYRNRTDRSPSFYLLEAGTATGDPKMIYFSPDMRPIPRATSYYLPTPFVSMRNTYSGSVTMQPPPHDDEPQRLLVRSYAPGEKEPYITVSVQYRRAPWVDLPAPIEITADAGARVALIARTMGLASAVQLQTLLANLGRQLTWRELPSYPSAAPAPKK